MCSQVFALALDLQAEGDLLVHRKKRGKDSEELQYIPGKTKKNQEKNKKNQ